MKAHLIFNGLGAGNIGDEAMFAGFLNALYPEMELTVEVFNADAPVVKTLPPNFKYITYTYSKKCIDAALRSDFVFLVGDTPVMEAWGLDWPMRFHYERLVEIKKCRKKIHALGVGVDRIVTDEGRALFQKGHLLVDSWTVRSEDCRSALIDLGVPADKVYTGADFAWLFTPEIDRTWAEREVESAGAETGRPLIGVNIVNERWGGINEQKRAIASALDKIATETGAQIVFICNETRDGEYFDIEAAQQTASLMSSAPVVLPNKYYNPNEMASILSVLTFSVSQRYHFTVLNVLAGTPVVSYARGNKVESLVKELGGSPLAGMEDTDPELLYKKIIEAFAKRDEIAKRQGNASAFLRARVYKNLYFVTRDELNQETRNAALARVSELETPLFMTFISILNSMARIWILRQFTNWSKVWEYPWLWFNGLCRIDWSRAKVLDLGSELSPMPWFLASLGAKVTLVETDTNSIHIWERIRRETGLSVDWKIIDDEQLPFRDEIFDVVTSFSVIEHQLDKGKAVNEIARVLKPGGTFALSFDICEPEMGMTFPEWNGKALTTREFEDIVWCHPAFDTRGTPINWNFEDCEEFIKWHLQSAPHHNYTVGAAVIHKIGLVEIS